MPRLEKRWNEDGAEVPGAAGNENVAFGHGFLNS
jgi:hypothetical protein